MLVSAAPGVVSTDLLVETLWNGAPPQTSRKSLQALLVRLRSALEPDRPRGSTGRFVVRRGQGYALAVERDDVDSLRIGDLAARGRARLASGAPADALQQLTLALALWRGAPYADWPEASFADVERRRLEEVRAGATEALLQARLAIGQQADAIPELERLVLQDPLREGWWSLLMLALNRDGRQADALAAARRARAVLQHELGADPGPDLRRVEAAILAQDPSLDPPERPPEVVPAPRDMPEPTGLPCPYKGLAAYQEEDATLFHGRRRLVAALVRRLVDTTMHVVSGPSGAGKSSLIRAGLVPALSQQIAPGSSAWPTLVVTPGSHPVDTLASLTGDSPPSLPVVLVCDPADARGVPRGGRGLGRRGQVGGGRIRRTGAPRPRASPLAARALGRGRQDSGALVTRSARRRARRPHLRRVGVPARWKGLGRRPRLPRSEVENRPAVGRRRRHAVRRLRQRRPDARPARCAGP